MAKKKHYAVARGRIPGIYDRWYGINGAEMQVKGFPNAVFKGFASQKEARDFLRNNALPHLGMVSSETESGAQRNTADAIGPTEAVTIYTDGGCLNNPGPGGYGVVLIIGDKRQERSGGFRWTTNNRMELMACIVGLETIKSRSRIILHSDSRYVVNGIEKGWAKRWRSNNWMRTRSDPALNADLWEKLLVLCGKHHVIGVWVKGHAGNAENERCDQLAT